MLILQSNDYTEPAGSSRDGRGPAEARPSLAAGELALARTGEALPGIPGGRSAGGRTARGPRGGDRGSRKQVAQRSVRAPRTIRQPARAAVGEVSGPGQKLRTRSRLDPAVYAVLDSQRLPICLSRGTAQIAAGLRWRCVCLAMVPTQGRV